MTIKIGINGFGRIGRNVLRSAIQNFSDIEVVAINDLLEPDYLAYMLQFDSVHGRFQGTVSVEGNTLIVNGKKIRLTQERDPANLKWNEVGADIVIESTGLFLDKATAQKHLDAGAKKVVLSAPSKDDTPMFVYGVNHETYAGQAIISNASCTTNCLAPPALVVHRAFGIEKALMTTVHSYTADQRLMDLAHKDSRRARAAALNIIPTTTGAAKAVALVIPELAGRFDGYSLRVPTPTVSVVDFVALLQKPADTETLRAELKKAAASDLKGIMACEDERLVSMDFKGDPHSSIIDTEFTLVLQKNMAKVVAWYDNEWGYSCRVADLAAYMVEKGI